MSAGPQCARLPGRAVARELAWVGSAPYVNGNVGDTAAEVGLAMLLEACDRAVEELDSSVPPAQLRALLVIEQAGGMNLSRLAAALGASASAASRLCHRMQAAGLLTRGRAASSRREIVLLPTESGRRLARWVRDRRHAAFANVLRSMTDDGREALVKALAELGIGLQG
jgi:DNA-binding MarR family transcriptional regulator